MCILCQSFFVYRAKVCFTKPPLTPESCSHETRPKRTRACLKIAFCKMPSQFASDFMLDLGGVVGYIDQIQRKIWCEVGRQIAGMNFQTCSNIIKRRDTPLILGISPILFFHPIFPGRIINLYARLHIIAVHIKPYAPAIVFH